jgi:prolipoprotein diacylglyceryltransferase
VTLTFGFDPVIAQWGPFQLGWHGIFTALAVAVGLWLAGRLAERRGMSSGVVYGIATWGVVGGIVGARLFHVADHLDFYLQNPLLIPAMWEGGIAVYGAFIGGLLGGGLPAWTRGRCWTSRRLPCWWARPSADSAACATAMPGARTPPAARSAWPSATPTRTICCRLI